MLRSLPLLISQHCSTQVVTSSLPAHMPLSASWGHVLMVSLRPQAALPQPPPPFFNSQLWRVSTLGAGLSLLLPPHSVLRGSHPVPGSQYNRCADSPSRTRAPTSPPCSHSFLVDDFTRTSPRHLRHHRPKGKSLSRSDPLLVPTPSHQFSRLKLGGHP